MTSDGTGVWITERIERKRGVTRYCTCDRETCGHVAGVCMYNAKVRATVNGRDEQLCQDCLESAQAGMR